MTRLKVDERTRTVLRHTAEVLRKNRQDAGFSQAQLAEAASMARENYAKVEHAEVNVTVDTLVRIAHGLGRHVRIELVEPTRVPSAGSVHFVLDSASASGITRRLRTGRRSREQGSSTGPADSLIRSLHAIMERRELSVSHLARSAKLSAPYLQDVLKGEQSPTLEVVERLAVALGVPVLDLLAPSKPPTRRSPRKSK